jgi:septal ring factor EnvC (AmiA/AmiB activator)
MRHLIRQPTRSRRLGVMLALGLSQGLAPFVSPPAAAQVSGQGLPQLSEQAETLLREAEIKRAQRAERDAELKAVEERLAANAEAKARLDAEIREIRADRGRLAAALIEATRRSQATEARIAAIEQRLEVMASSEQGIRRSLAGRRGLIGDVLAALQRMGRRPLPAVLVRPEDVLDAVRASILMGAVIPELRGEVETLAVDLAELVRLRAQGVVERGKVALEFDELASERARIAALVEARRTREADASGEAAGIQQRGVEIGREAASLRELIDRLEGEISTAGRLAEDARRRAEAQTRQVRERMAQLAFRDPSRLIPQAAFQDLRGLLPRPVAGSQLRGFSDGPQPGSAMRGESWQARPGAIVSAPADGWVAFSGPFLTFGNMVILQMGGGYHILLAGLRRTDVARGQFVLAGEPVGVLGEGPEGTATVLGDGNGQPILYVEFHKDGRSIDPGPWWATTQVDRVRG